MADIASEGTVAIAIAEMLREARTDTYALRPSENESGHWQVSLNIGEQKFVITVAEEK